MVRKEKIYSINQKAKLIAFFILFQISLTFSYPASSMATDNNPPDRLNRYFLNHLLTNSKNTLISPLKWEKSDWLKAGLCSAAIISFLPADNSIHKWIGKNRSDTTDSVARAFSAAGRPAVLLGVISLGYIYGEINDKQESRKTFLLAGESLLITELIVQLGKITIGRARPYTEQGAFSFHPFNFKGKWQSFPSGHAASAWALAACLASRSESPYLDAALYSVAAGISLSRVFLDKHYPSDVLAASLLGYFIGKKISRPSKPPEDKPAIALVFNRGIIAFSLYYNF
jgi:hypothetical protein